MLIWLADVLRAAGLKVVEQPGWQERGRSDMPDPVGILCHHTAGPRLGNAPSLALVQNGRRDLPGPLSQLVLGRDGTWYIVAAGRSNHAGAGNWQGVTAGNSHFIGVEAENVGDGTEPWPVEQMDSYVRGCAAILKYLKVDSVMVAGHKEYALPRGRKIDPSFDMVDFREHVEAVMAVGRVPDVAVATVSPLRAMLRKGDRGESVGELQRRLDITVDKVFGPVTELAVKTLQARSGLKVDGLVGPATWKALGVS